MPITDALPDMERELKFFRATNDNPAKAYPRPDPPVQQTGLHLPLGRVHAGRSPRPIAAISTRSWTQAKANGHNSYSINGWHRHCRGIYDLLHEPRILDYVEDLLGPNLVSVMTHYFCKEPGEQKQVAWHQDASYWPADPEQGGDRLAGHRTT